VINHQNKLLLILSKHLPKKSILFQIYHYQCSSKFNYKLNEIFSFSFFRCQVLYDYTPQNPDELEIHVGDIINIIEMCDDGWYCGMMEKSNDQNTMEFGTFPGNYVKLLPV
jgi:hypothetical protein